jgi:hypothetical protein
MPEKITVSLDARHRRLIEKILASDEYQGDSTPEQVLLWALRRVRLHSASPFNARGLGTVRRVSGPRRDK